MKGSSLLLEYLGNHPKLRILDFLIDNRSLDYSRNEIMEGSGVSRNTFYKLWPTIERTGLIKKTRKIGRAELYKLNEDNTVVQELLKLDQTLGRQAAEKAARIQIPAYPRTPRQVKSK
jgi:DNA-binding transcriptional ArsR family regulator